MTAGLVCTIMEKSLRCWPAKHKWLEAVAIRLETIPIRLEAIASRLVELS